LVHALPVGRRTDPTWPALNRRRPRPRRTAPPRQARPLAGRRHRPASRRGRPRRAPVRHGRSRGGPGIPGAGDVGWVGARSPGALRATRHAALRRGPRRGPVAWTAASGAYGTASPPPGGEASGRFRRVRHGVRWRERAGHPSRGIADGSVTGEPRQPPKNGRVPTARSRSTGRPGCARRRRRAWSAAAG